ncbi:MAG: PKD domain-containing protein, partial [Thermoplasmata archaeon]|nr:PKD domain-containing protein [Thermoplasmata archaeon]
VTFAGTAVGGTPEYTYLWTFGDGGASTSPEPSHTYVTAGTFVATFYVWDANGTSQTASLNISVAAPAGSRSPTNSSAVPVVSAPDWTWIVALGLGFFGGAAWSAAVPIRWRRRRRGLPPRRDAG